MGEAELPRERVLLEDIVAIGRVCGTGNPGAVQWALDEIDALRASLTTLVVAAGRMLDSWAEGDVGVRTRLWQALHSAADAADDRHGIYPLRTSDSPLGGDKDDYEMRAEHESLSARPKFATGGVVPKSSAVVIGEEVPLPFVVQPWQRDALRALWSEALDPDRVAAAEALIDRIFPDPTIPKGER